MVQVTYTDPINLPPPPDVYVDLNKLQQFRKSYKALVGQTALEVSHHDNDSEVADKPNLSDSGISMDDEQVVDAYKASNARGSYLNKDESIFPKSRDVAPEVADNENVFIAPTQPNSEQTPQAPLVSKTSTLTVGKQAAFPSLHEAQLVSMGPKRTKLPYKRKDSSSKASGVVETSVIGKTDTEPICSEIESLALSTEKVGKSVVEKPAKLYSDVVSYQKGSGLPFAAGTATSSTDLKNSVARSGPVLQSPIVKSNSFDRKATPSASDVLQAAATTKASEDLRKTENNTVRISEHRTTNKGPSSLRKPKKPIPKLSTNKFLALVKSESATSQSFVKETRDIGMKLFSNRKPTEDQISRKSVQESEDPILGEVVAEIDEPRAPTLSPSAETSVPDAPEKISRRQKKRENLIKKTSENKEEVGAVLRFTTEEQNSMKTLVGNYLYTMTAHRLPYMAFHHNETPMPKFIGLEMQIFEFATSRNLLDCFTWDLVMNITSSLNRRMSYYEFSKEKNKKDLYLFFFILSQCFKDTEFLNYSDVLSQDIMYLDSVASTHRMDQLYFEMARDFYARVKDSKIEAFYPGKIFEGMKTQLDEKYLKAFDYYVKQQFFARYFPFGTGAAPSSDPKERRKQMMDSVKILNKKNAQQQALLYKTQRVHLDRKTVKGYLKDLMPESSDSNPEAQLFRKFYEFLLEADSTILNFDVYMLSLGISNPDQVIYSYINNTRKFASLLFNYEC